MKKRIMALFLSASMVTTVLGNVSFVSYATSNENLEIVTTNTDDASSEDNYSVKGNDAPREASEGYDLINDKNLDESFESRDDFSSTEESKEKTEYDNLVSEKDSTDSGDNKGDDESVSVKESDCETEQEGNVESSHSDIKYSDEVAADEDSSTETREESDQDGTLNGNSDTMHSNSNNEGGSIEDGSNDETKDDVIESGSDISDDIADETEKETDEKFRDDQFADDDHSNLDNKALSEESDMADDMLNADNELDSDEKDKLSEEDKTEESKEKTESVTEIKTAVDGMTIIVSGDDLTDITVSAKIVELEDDILASYFENAEIIKAVDIKLFDADEKEWQPEENGQIVSVEIRGIELPDESKPVSVVRIDDAVLEEMADASPESVQIVSADAENSDGNIEFEADHFTVYAMLLTETNKNVISNGTCGDNITWEITREDGIMILTINGNGEVDDYGGIYYTPWYSYRYDINKIVLSGNITHIGNYAFQNLYDLTEVVMTDSVTTIGKYAFQTCKKLTEVQLSQSLLTIDDAAFSSCEKLENITLPDSLVSIGYNAFVYCENLESIELPCNLQELGSQCFGSCTKLRSLQIPASVSKIGTFLVSDDGSLRTLSVDSDNPVYDSRNDCNAIIQSADNTLIAGCSTTVIPEGITRIESKAFGYVAFDHPLVIPSSVTSIGEESFYECTIGNLELPENVTTIESCAFYRSHIYNLELPDSLTTIGVAAFAYNCFEELVIPHNVTMNGNTFGSNKNLTYVSIQPGLKVIGDYVFDDCSSLKEISIPVSVTSIGSDNFNYLTDVYYAGSKEEWDVIFGKDNVPSSATIHYNCTAEDVKEIRFLSIECTHGSCTQDVLNNDFILYPDDGEFSLVCTAKYAGSNEGIHYTIYDGNYSIADSDDGVFTLDTNKFGKDTIISIEAIKSGKLHTKKETLLKITDPEIDCNARSYHRYADVLWNGNIDFHIDEHVFLKSANAYDHSIANYACGLSTMAYTAPTDTNSEIPDSMVTCLLDLGYKEDSLFFTKDVDGIYSTFWFAAKPLHDDTTLVTVVVQGTDGDEWFDNFDPRTGETHLGFQRGCNAVKLKLEQYLNSQHLSGKNIKFLITGHSRGAAVANLLGHDLTTGELFGQNFRSDDIFVYTFATPNVSKNASSVCYEENIFNIVNPEDFVTKIPANSWGYDRYGITLELPSSSNTNAAEYYLYLYDLREWWKCYYPQFDKLYEPYKGGMERVTHYVNSVTSTVRNIDEYYSLPLDSQNSALYNLYTETLATFCTGHVATAVNNITQIYLLKKYGSLGVETANFFGVNEAAFHYFSYGHQSETYLAAMRACSEELLLRNKRAIYGRVNCPVDVTILNGNGDVVGEIKNNTITESSDGISLSVDGDSKTFMFPADSDYQVRLTGNDTGHMDYSLCKYNCDTLTGPRVYYHDVPVSTTTTFIDNIDPDVAFEDLQLTDSSGNSVSKSVISKDSTGTLSVIVSIEGNGSASSLFNMTPGDYAQLTAYPEEDSKFAGWYKDGKIISTDETYGFSIAQNENITAKFVPVSSNDEGSNESTTGGNNNNSSGTTGTNPPFGVKESTTSQNNGGNSSSQNNNSQTSPSTNGKAGITSSSSGGSINITPDQSINGAGNQNNPKPDGGSTELAKNTIPTKAKIKLNYTKLTLGKGGKFNLTAKITGAKKKPTIKWSSSNKKVAMVNNKGEITAKAKGKCTITAKTSDGKVKATCTLTIKKDSIKVKKATVNKKKISLKKGKTFALKAGFTPYNATISSISYTTSDKKIATVSKKGVIKAKKKGKCTITVKIKDKAKKTKTVKCTVTVK